MPGRESRRRARREWSYGVGWSGPVAALTAWNAVAPNSWKNFTGLSQKSWFIRVRLKLTPGAPVTT